MSTHQKALVLPIKQGTFELHSVPIPTPGPGQLLVRMHAVALNPVDWKVQARGILVEDYPFILGTDNAGTVEVIGEEVYGFSKGDRVFTQGTFESTHGGFQQYALFNASVTAKIPENLTFEQAATIPVGLGTAVLGLYTPRTPEDIECGSAQLTAPWDSDGRGIYAGRPFVVLGASSSVGQYALQLARLSGFSPIIVTASLHHTDYLKSLGATHVVDRHLPFEALRSNLAAITSKPFEVIFDAVSLPDTQSVAYDLLAPGGCLVLVLFPAITLIANKRIAKVFGQVNFPPENLEVGVSLYKVLPELLAEGAIQPNRVEVIPGGLGGIRAGLDRLKNDTVSGVKLVVRSQETA